MTDEHEPDTDEVGVGMGDEDRPEEPVIEEPGEDW